MTEYPSRSVPVGVLRDLMERLIAAAGCDEEMARVAADVFLEANLRRIDHQGLDYMTKFVGAIRKKKVEPNGRPRVLRQGPAFALVDGGTGPGQFTGIFAGDLAVEKARRAGSAAVGVTNSSDMYMVGYFVDRIAEQGQVGLLFSVSPPLGHPHGGVERMLGTSPLAVAIPTDEDYNFLIDLSTTALAHSTVRTCHYHGEPIPEGCALDAEGNPTTDAAKAMEGVLSPLAGAKGFALGLFVAFLSGPLVGSGAGSVLNDRYEGPTCPAGNKGHFFVAIDPGVIGDRQGFLDRVGGAIREIKGTARALGSSEIRISGERVYRARAKSVADGFVPIDEVVWRNTAALAAELGVTMPD